LVGWLVGWFLVQVIYNHRNLSSIVKEERKQVGAQQIIVSLFTVKAATCLLQNQNHHIPRVVFFNERLGLFHHFLLDGLKDDWSFSVAHCPHAVFKMKDWSFSVAC
jgi:hypothetical protein